MGGKASIGGQRIHSCGYFRVFLGELYANLYFALCKAVAYAAVPVWLRLCTTTKIRYKSHMRKLNKLACSGSDLSASINAWNSIKVLAPSA
eukprot:1299774-Pleurochrysis_carterae.AAC.2